jgi:hypothetical protein
MREHTGTPVFRPAIGALAAAALLALAACGGGGGSAPQSAPPPAAQPPATPTTGKVAVLFTDAPTDAFCQILATVERIDLLGGSNPTNVFIGPETVDVLSLRNFSDLFSIATEVPVGSYEKVRLTLSDLALVECDAEGTPEPEARWERPKLPGNGKLDLNPRGSFQVVGGETLVIEIDMDMTKSLHLVKAGNSGRWQFRPVVFVTIAPDDTKLVRVFGEARELGATSFLLCPLAPPSSMGEGAMVSNPDRDRCIDVATDDRTGIFGEDGLPVGLSSVASGDPLTAIGFLSAYNPTTGSRTTRLRLDAVVLEIGPLDAFQRIAGAAVTAPGNNDIFEFLPSAASDPAAAIDVLLQSGTRIFAIGSNEELTSAALQPGTNGEVDGVFTDPATEGEPLRAALVVLEQGASAPEVALIDRTIASTAAADPATTPPSGTITLEDTTPAAAFTCVKTSVATRFLEITETPTSSETSEVDFAALAAGNKVDVYGSDDGAGCVLADTVQKYVAPAP